MSATRKAMEAVGEVSRLLTSRGADGKVGKLPTSRGAGHLTGACHSYLAEGALYHPHRAELLCPKCSAYFDMCNMAHVNLEELVGPIIELGTAVSSRLR